MEKMRDTGISVSRRFEDLLAQNIERGQVSMTSVQNVLDKTIDRVQEQDFNIDTKVRNGENLQEIYTDYYVSGERAGYVMSVEDRDKGNGIVSAVLDNKNSKKETELFSILKEGDVYKTDKGQKMSFGEASELAGKALKNAINTYRVIDTFKAEVGEYIDARRVESEMKKIDSELFPGKNRETERSRKLEEELPSPEVKGKEEPQKEYGGIDL